MKTVKKMKVIETSKYKALKAAYTNQIFNTLVSNSPRPVVSSIRLDARLLETDNDATKQSINNLYQNIISKSHYRPFLTTTTFKYMPLTTSSMKQQYRFLTDATWHQYSKTYRFIISNLTNNFTKKSYLYPKTYDFFDVPNTRKGPKAVFTENTLPHIHSIYLVHEHTLEKFQRFVDEEFQSVVNHPSICDFVRTIHAEPIDKDLPRAVSYCSKFYDNHYARSIRDEYNLFHQFPITNAEKELLAKEREDAPFMIIKRLMTDTNTLMKQRFNRSK
jgi:hypothetical protein